MTSHLVTYMSFTETLKDLNKAPHLAVKLLKSSVALHRGGEPVTMKLDPTQKLGQPSILLIHGFTGGHGELEELDNDMRDDYGIAVHRMYWEPCGKQTIASLAHRAMKVIRAIDEASGGAPLGVIGHSMGGLITAEIEEQAQVEGIDIEAFTAIASPFQGVMCSTKVGPFITRTELSEERKGRYIPRDVSKWLTIAADEDTTVAKASALVAGTQQMLVLGEDHSSIVTNDQVHDEIANFCITQFGKYVGGGEQYNGKRN